MRSAGLSVLVIAPPFSTSLEKGPRVRSGLVIAPPFSTKLEKGPGDEVGCGPMQIQLDIRAVILK